jgi:AraC-like DNA-binding protein
MNDIIAIKNYVLFLKKECGLAVTLHTNNSGLILKKELLVFNIHENPYCIYVKNCPSAHVHCVEKQGKIVEKCKGGSFVGTCWAGVKEYVYPIMHEKDVVGFICVSGFAEPKANEYLLSVSKKYNLPYEQLQIAYGTLKKDMPPKEYVDTLIYPLCHMLELAHLKADTFIKKQDTLINRVVQFIKKNYTQNLTSSLLCKEFSCSRSYLSKLFNTTMSATIPEYITNLRIDSAKSLLQHTNLEVSEIALSVGFNESYYFAMQFKKLVGKTPSAYRKQCK